MASAASLRSMHQKLDGFYARGYLATWCESVRPEWTVFLDTAFSKVIPALLPGLPSPRVADLGCGPSISNIISASGWSSCILMCDVLPSNREEIAKFRGEAEDAFSWRHYFVFLSTLESGGHLLSPEELYERTRGAIQEICHCDITQPLCQLDQQVASRGLFHVAIASLVLDVVSTSEEMFHCALLNVKGILKPDCGLLLIQGSLGESVYTVGSALFPVMNIDEEKLRRLFAVAGFEIVKLEISRAETSHYFGLLRIIQS